MTGRPALGLGIGVLAVSCASIVIRFCTVPALAIGMWRLSLAALGFLLWAAWREPAFWRRPSADLLAAAGAGLCLALHFGTWIASLSYTTVAASVVLVTTNPIFVALGARLFYKEPVSPRLGLGIALATAGGAIIALSGGDSQSAPNPLLGNGLALIGAVCASSYFLIGRSLRERLSTPTYVGLVYGTGGLFAALLCLLFRTPVVGWSAHNWLLLVILAVVPQGIGHTMFNWALRFVSPAVVAVSVLGEPIGAIILAWLYLHEIPQPLAALGCGLILTGVVLAGRK